MPPTPSRSNASAWDKVQGHCWLRAMQGPTTAAVARSRDHREYAEAQPAGTVESAWTSVEREHPGIRGGIVRVQVSVEGADERAKEAELRSLHGWLQSDRQTRSLTVPKLEALDSLVPGAQGPVIDVLSLVLGSTFNAASLAMSLISWRATRPRQPILTVRRPDGTTVEINTGSLAEARVLLEQLGLE
ncbi:effector-associated constant component EACC1 [Streptomyces sp. NBC_00252]|uniref:effector-associated constant component EACC1 n=1 Tax=Streptomyces sp. NBC_00252 TaxID=2975691 RepID=UPI002E2C9B81|nr:hypothetical protein [Streptomyces sp. NBC_00252]